MSKHFKMYITITDIIGEKIIDLDYPIKGKEVADVSVFSSVRDREDCEIIATKLGKGFAGRDIYGQ